MEALVKWKLLSKKICYQSLSRPINLY